MQRKNSFALCLVLAAAAASIVSSHALAQGSATAKGSWIIDGSAGVSSQHTEGSSGSVTSISVAPSGLYFVSPGLAVGGRLLFGYSNNPSSTSKSFGIGPSFRYYFGDRTSKTMPFVSATVEPIWQSNDPKSSTGQSTSSTNTLVEGSIGFTHLVATHVGITGEAYYDHFSFSADIGSNHADQSAYVVGLRFGVTAFVF